MRPIIPNRTHTLVPSRPQRAFVRPVFTNDSHTFVGQTGLTVCDMYSFFHFPSQRLVGIFGLSGNCPTRRVAFKEAHFFAKTYLLLFLPLLPLPTQIGTRTSLIFIRSTRGVLQPLPPYSAPRRFSSVSQCVVRRYLPRYLGRYLTSKMSGEYLASRIPSVQSPPTPSPTKLSDISFNQGFRTHAQLLEVPIDRYITSVEVPESEELFKQTTLTVNTKYPSPLTDCIVTKMAEAARAIDSFDLNFGTEESIPKL